MIEDFVDRLLIELNTNKTTKHFKTDNIREPLINQLNKKTSNDSFYINIDLPSSRYFESNIESELTYLRLIKNKFALDNAIKNDFSLLIKKYLIKKDIIDKKLGKDLDLNLRSDLYVMRELEESTLPYSLLARYSLWLEDNEGGNFYSHKPLLLIPGELCTTSLSVNLWEKKNSTISREK